MRRTIFNKYGGTSVGTVRRINSVAEQTLAVISCGLGMVIILSAMSGETNRLVDVISQVNDKPNLGSVDFAISTGEQISVGLLSAALWKIGITNNTLTGWQLPICTNGPHTNSIVTVINIQVLRVSQLEHNATLVTGFQGLNQLKNITTLGRGGSDTSAVALSATLGPWCGIYTDVKGVYTTDPRLEPEARLLTRMSFEEAYEMSSYGSKVIHSRSLLMSGRYNTDMNIISSFTRFIDRRTHTEVHFDLTKQKSVERSSVTSITLRKTRALITLRSGLCPGLVDQRLPQLISQSLSQCDIISHSVNNCIAFISLSTGQCQIVGVEAAMLQMSGSILNVRASQIDSRVSELSVVGLGLRLPGFMLGILSELKIRTKSTIFSGIRLTLLTKEHELLVTIGKLHHYLFGR